MYFGKYECMYISSSWKDLFILYKVNTMVVDGLAPDHQQPCFDLVTSEYSMFQHQG